MEFLTQERNVKEFTSNEKISLSVNSELQRRNLQLFVIYHIDDSNFELSQPLLEYFFALSFRYLTR